MSLSRLSWRKVAKLRHLPGPKRRLLLGAALWLLLVDLGLRILGFARVRRLLSRNVAPASEAAVEADRWAEVDTVAWAVAVAASHHLYPMKCLPRSLVLWRFLARRGIPGELQIGVRKEGTELLAHAWVEHAGRPVGEGEGVEHRYASLSLPAP